jgi:hypothetical protein
MRCRALLARVTAGSIPWSHFSIRLVKLEDRPRVAGTHAGAARNECVSARATPSPIVFYRKDGPEELPCILRAFAVPGRPDCMLGLQLTRPGPAPPQRQHEPEISMGRNGVREAQHRPGQPERVVPAALRPGFRTTGWSRLSATAAAAPRR